MNQIDIDKKIIRELQVWTWIAILLPGSSIFGVVILWAVGLTSQIGMFIVISSIVVLSIAIIWWWWAIHVVGTFVRSRNATHLRIQELIKDVQEVRELVLQTQERVENCSALRAYLEKKVEE